MEASYDEDLSENSFLQVLRQEYPSIFEKAVSEGLVICVPRCGTFTKSALVEDDFLSHILIPDRDNSSPRFHTLAGKEIKVSNRVLTVEYDIAKPCSAHLLFEETFYTDRRLKYSLWCIEHPLERSISASRDDVFVVTNLREALDLLWTEVFNKDIIKEMTMAIEEFQERHEDLEDLMVDTQRDLVGRLYARNLRMLLQDIRLREKTESNRHFLRTIKIATETYTLHGLRNVLPRSVAARTSYEDALLNKTIKNLHDVQLRDLGVRSDTYDGILRGKLELSRLTLNSTVLGKVGCLKKAIRYVTEQGTRNRLVSTDDILPVLIFLVIRAGVPNWIGQLTFMRQFRFSTDSTNNETDEAGFLITSLEAAIEHVKSGVLKATTADYSEIFTENKNYDHSTNSFNRKPEDDTISLANLFSAIRQSNLTEVDRILGQSGSCSKTCATEALKLCHPLCTCETCERRIAGASLTHLPTVHSRDDRGMTAIHVASLCGHVNVVDYLLEHEADPNDSDADGTTPLHCAASRGHQNTLLLLLHANADPTITDSRGNTPLHLASDHGHEGCVKAIIYFTEQMAIPMKKSPANSNGETPLHHAAKWGYDNIVEILMEHGANPRATNRRGQTPLVVAHNSRVSKLLQTPPNVRLSNYVSTYPLGIKIPNKAPNFQRTLANNSRRSNPSRKVHRLLAAVVENDVRLACFYLGLDAPFPKTSINHQSPALCHPLCNCDRCNGCDDCTSNEGLSDALEKTQSLGLNISNESNETALHVACDHGHTEMVEILLDAGASINLKTINGRTPLHLASSRGWIKIVKLLLNCGNCDINAIDVLGDTSLHLVARSGNVRIVQLLIRYGASTNIRNSRGITPLEEVEKISSSDIFMTESYSNVVKILKNNRATNTCNYEIE
ncbi:ankyrin repeat domain-containing protein 27-like [Venturia canescens]|uniref:ankyrin repeat domain-containing protein 27-like n=1 Tax=Venturia canescens TaxID=32260 RepID=UPI001C9CCBE6|nr:ankyrin repeat domain-containing protein 27-like [Venturia canescens]